GAPGLRRRRPRRLVGDVDDADAPARARGRGLSRPAARDLLTAAPARAELSAPRWWPGLRRASGHGRSGCRESHQRRPDCRGHAPGAPAARRHGAPGPASLAVLRDPILPDELLAPRARGDDGRRCRRFGARLARPTKNIATSACDRPPTN